MAGNFFVKAFCKNSARFAPTRAAIDSNLGRNSCLRGATLDFAVTKEGC